MAKRKTDPGQPAEARALWSEVRRLEAKLAVAEEERDDTIKAHARLQDEHTELREATVELVNALAALLPREHAGSSFEESAAHRALEKVRSALSEGRSLGDLCRRWNEIHLKSAV